MNASISELQRQVQRHIAAREYPQAKDLCERICMDNPANAAAWNALGVLSGKLGDFQKAEQAFNHLIKLDPHNLQAHVNLGKVLESLNRMDDAEFCYRAATSWDQSGDVYMALGTLLGRCKRYDEAARCFHYVLQAQPDNDS